MTPEKAPSSRSAAFLFLFTNQTFLCSIAVTWGLFSIWYSLCTNNWTWFARSGSILGIIGAVLSCRSVLRLTREERIRIRNMNMLERFTSEELEDQERDSAAAVVGAVLLVLGTLIWAYGDLLPKIELPSCPLASQH